MHDYISTTELLSESLSRGLDLGKGQPREHLSYLTKIGLLPPAKKKKNTQGFIEGYYPMTVIEQLETVSKMKRQGMTFSQMKFMLRQADSRLGRQIVGQTDKTAEFEPPMNYPTASLPGSQVSYLPILIIGILLGYLLAISRGSTLPPMINSVSAQNLTVSQTASVSQPTIDSSKESIYVVSIPSSHFGNLDKEINIKF